MISKSILVFLNSTLLLVSGLLAFLLFKVNLEFLFLIIFSLFIYLNESNKFSGKFIYDKIIFILLSILLLVIIFQINNFFLFLDDKYYFENSKFYLDQTYIELILKYFQERDLDYNNFIYFSSLLFKIFGHSQVVFWFFNAVLLFRIISFLFISSHDDNNLIYLAPYELIFFCFFLFKDLLLIFFIIEFFRYSIKSNNYFKIFIFSLCLILCIDPLRIGYAYFLIFVLILFKFFDLKKFIIKPYFLNIVVLFIILYYSINYLLPFFSEELSYKYNFYRISLIDRSASSSGFLSLFYESFYSGNIFAAIPIVLFAVFIPLLSIPESETQIVLMIIRFITLFHFLFLILNFNLSFDKNRNDIFLFLSIFIIASASHLLVASGMLRHSAVILPFMYYVLLNLKFKKSV